MIAKEPKIPPMPENISKSIDMVSITNVTQTIEFSLEPEHIKNATKACVT